MKKYCQLTKPKRRALVELCANLVKQIVEHDLGPIPIGRMEDELADRLDEWVDEFDSECELAHKIMNDEFSVKAVQTNEHGEQELKF